MVSAQERSFATSTQPTLPGMCSRLGWRVLRIPFHSFPDANRFDALKPRALNREEKESVIKLALSVLAERHRAGRALGSPEQTRSFLRLKLVDRKHEVFGALFLDNRHRVIQVVEMFQGTIDGASVHPRVVVQRALEVNAAAVVFFHNHPSGVAEPSHADEAITRRLAGRVGAGGRAGARSLRRRRRRERVLCRTRTPLSPLVTIDLPGRRSLPGREEVRLRGRNPKENHDEPSTE
jgi:DNA repair protein RadC